MADEKRIKEEIQDNTLDNGDVVKGVITIVIIAVLIVLTVIFWDPLALKVADGLCFNDKPFFCDFAAKYLSDTEEQRLDYYVRDCGCGGTFKTDKYIKKGCHEAGLIFEKRWRRYESLSKFDVAEKNAISAVKYFKVGCDSSYKSSCIKLDLIKEELRQKDNKMDASEHRDDKGL